MSDGVFSNKEYFLYNSIKKNLNKKTKISDRFFLTFFTSFSLLMMRKYYYFKINFDKIAFSCSDLIVNLNVP